LWRPETARLSRHFATQRDYFRDPNGCVPAVAIQKPIDAMVEEKLIDQRVEFRLSQYQPIGFDFLPGELQVEGRAIHRAFDSQLGALDQLGGSNQVRQIGRVGGAWSKEQIV